MTEYQIHRKYVNGIKIVPHSQYLATNRSEGLFTTGWPDMSKMIQALDLFDSRVSDEVIRLMHQAGHLICAEQRRLAPFDFLRNAITVGQVKAKVKKDMTLPTGKNYEARQVVGITSGYHSDAFNYQQTARAKYRTHTASRNGIVHDGDYWMSASKASPGVIGMTWEFGRPGKSTAHHRNAKTMKQVRRRIPDRTDLKSWKNRKNWGEAVPTEVEINKGAIQPIPHIGRGMLNKEVEAAKLVAAGLKRLLNSAWSANELAS